MSPMADVEISGPSKFTRGEKCIFIHLVITFVFILILTVTYFVHIYLVEHPGDSYLNTRRSSQQRLEENEAVIPDYLPIGALYLNASHSRAVCNTIQLRETWSITPGHCVIIRTDPAMAQWLPEWVIEYRSADFKFLVTGIKRSIAHPKFDRDDFSNNIGLLEHSHTVPIHKYISFRDAGSKTDVLRTQDETLHLTQWMPHLANKDLRSDQFNLHSVDRLDRAQCNNYMAPIVDLRSYEYCVSLRKDQIKNLNHGAALLRGYEVEGFFSWGERRGRTLPIVILNIAEFKDWIQDTVATADTFN